MRVLDNFAYVGGLGLASDMVGAAQWGDLGSFLTGPTATDFVTVGNALLSGEVRSIIGRGMRTPAFQMGHFLSGSAILSVDKLAEYVRMSDLGGAQNDDITSLGDLLTARIQQKGLPQL